MMRCVSMMPLLLLAAAAAGAQDQGSNDKAAPANCSYRVFHAYSECKPDNFWYVVTDGYYVCANGTADKQRVQEVKTDQKCNAPQSPPAPAVGGTIKEGLVDCQAPKAIGDLIVQQCINGIWYNVFYKRYECLDKSIRMDAARYFNTGAACGPGQSSKAPALPANLGQNPTNLGTQSPAPTPTAAPSASNIDQPPPSPVVLKTTLVGVVLPSDARPGDTISGTVVTNPDQYNDVPALRVVRAEVPASQDAQGHASLQGLVIDTGDGTPQPADNGVVIKTAKNATEVPLIFRRGNTTTPVAEQTLPLRPPDTTAGDAPTPLAEPSATPAPQDYETPTVCVDGGTQVIRGPFGGNRADTQILVDEKPARIVAESPRAAYWQLPQGTQPGPHRVTLHERGAHASFQVAVLRIDMAADQLELLKGQSTRYRAIVSGPERLPESAWRPGTPSDMADIGHIREQARDFKIPGAQEPGVILLWIRNVSTDTITISPANNEAVVLSLGREQFAKGPYEFSGTIKSKRSGRFNIQGVVVPFLAPVKGEIVAATRPEAPVK